MQEILDTMNGYSLRLSLPFLPPPPQQRPSPAKACAMLLYRYGIPNVDTTTTITDSSTGSESHNNNNNNNMRSAKNASSCPPPGPPPLRSSSSSVEEVNPASMTIPQGGSSDSLMSASPRSSRPTSVASSPCFPFPRHQFPLQSGGPRALLSVLHCERLASFMLPAETIVLASSSMVASVKLLMNETVLHQVSTPPKHGGEFSGVASAQDSVVLSCGLGVTQYSVPRLRLMDDYEGIGHSDAALCIDCTDDGLFIATGGRDAAVVLWSKDDGPLKYMMGHTDWVRFVRFHTSGRLRRMMLFSASDDGTVVVWDPLQGSMLCRADFHGRSIRCFDAASCANAFSRNSGSGDTPVTGSPVSSSGGGGESSGYGVVALTFDASPIQLLRLRSSSDVESEQGGGGGSEEDGHRRAGFGGGLDAAPGQPIHHHRRNSSIGSNNSGNILFSRSRSGSVSTDGGASSSGASGNLLVLLASGGIDNPHRGSLTALRFSQNGAWILTSSEDETIAVSSVADRAVLWTSSSLVSRRRCISFMNTISSIAVVASPPQSSVIMICACSSDGDVLFWVIDPRDGRASYERKIQLQIGSLLSICVVKSQLLMT